MIGDRLERHAVVRGYPEDIKDRAIEGAIEGAAVDLARDMLASGLIAVEKKERSDGPRHEKATWVTVSIHSDRQLLFDIAQSRESALINCYSVIDGMKDEIRKLIAARKQEEQAILALERMT